ncbi:unnamed protein product [Adineta steineri]|uniref:Uncharacterized protein n=1 Tax=Adineta steineri TaxID=433720 RepID=A0A814HUH4_9BILA|nr:unnamed protein product [Adineta steineri]CAF3792948.1 unnamed protein product [Adineta steineri]
MFCEHPICSLETNSVCTYHCHLPICQKHRYEHEKNLLNEIEKQLVDLSDPISVLLSQTRNDFKESEESRQRELTRINSLFDCRISSTDRRLKLARTTNELIIVKREQILQYKTGDNQLTQNDYHQIETISNEIRKNLLQLYQLNNEINNQNSNIDLWPIEQEKSISTNIECIVLTDSEDEILRNTDRERLSSMNSTHQLAPIEETRELPSTTLRDFCPLTQYGVFGLNSSHNIARLCSKKKKQQLYLYKHFRRTHHIEPEIAHQLIKAIRNNCNPIETKIFPQNTNRRISIENIRCPFDNTANDFNEENSIPNTPCYISCVDHDFKNHLQNIHSITTLNVELIYNAMKNYGTISYVQFEEDLCQIK